MEVAGRPLPAWWGATALAAAAAAGAVVARRPELFELGRAPDLADLLAAAAAGLAGLLLLARPALALVLTIVFVELNLSEVLVRFHGLPSLLRLLALPLVALALVVRPPRDRAELARSPLLLLAAAHAALAAASSFWAAEPARALDVAERSVKALFVAAIVAALVDSRARLRLAAWAMVASGCLLGALAVVQSATGRFDDEWGGLARVKQAQIWGDVFEPRVAGPLGDPNFFAQALVVLVPVALALGWSARRRGARLLAFAAAALLAVAIGLTYSRGAALATAAVVALSFTGHGLDPRRTAAALALLGVVAVALPADLVRRLTTLEQAVGDPEEAALHPDSSFAKRRLLTRAAWEMFLDRPLAGVGAGNYTVRFEPYGDRVGSPAPDYDDPGEERFPHSFPLEVAAETGALGLALLGALLATALLTAERASRALARAGARAEAALARALGLGLAGFLLAALFLHLRFERELWLLFGLIAALPALARRAAAAAPAGEGA